MERVVLSSKALVDDLDIGVLGLAAGGQMYSSCHLKLLIISLISLNRVQKIYRDADSPRVCTAPSRCSLINRGVF